MKRLFTFVTLALCLALVFCSCGELSIYNKDVLDADVDYNKVTLAAVPALDGYTEYDSENQIALLKKEADNGDVTYMAYNVQSGKSVWTKTVAVAELDKVGVYLTDAFVTVATEQEDGTDLYDMYDLAGKAIFTGAKEYDTVNDCIVWDGVHVYRYNPETCEKMDQYDRSYLDGPIPEVDTVYNLSGTGYLADYYYLLEDGVFTIYDNRYNVVMTYLPESGLEFDGYYVLENGNVLIQGILELPDDATKYDLYMDGEKAEVRSFLLNPKKGKVSEPELEYAIEYSLINDGGVYEYFDESVKNIAQVMFIENKTIDYDNTRGVILNNKGEIEEYIDELDGIRVERIEPMGNGYVVVEDLQGNEYLYTKKMKLIGEITGADFWTGKYLANDYGIFNYKREMVLDLTSDTYENYYVEGSIGDNLILVETLEEPTVSGVYERYYLWNGTLKEVATNLTWGDTYYLGAAEVYCVRTIEGTKAGQNSIYSPNGDLLFVTTDSLYGIDESAYYYTLSQYICLISYTNAEGEEVFAKLTVG